MGTMVVPPKTLAECADRLYEVRERRLAAQKAVDDLAAEEGALKVWIIDQLPKSNATGIAGQKARVTVKTKVVPEVTDWQAFYKYIAKNSAFELLQRRVGESAVIERWNDNKEIPGVGHRQIPYVSINKV